MLRSKYSRKPVANSQNRKLCVSLIVLIHQYVLLLALVQAQKGPTANERFKILKDITMKYRPSNSQLHYLARTSVKYYIVAHEGPLTTFNSGLLGLPWNLLHFG